MQPMSRLMSISVCIIARQCRRCALTGHFRAPCNKQYVLTPWQIEQTNTQCCNMCTGDVCNVHIVQREGWAIRSH
jgi:hypothetical protein